MGSAPENKHQELPEAYSEKAGIHEIMSSDLWTKMQFNLVSGK